jgi:hypothetical protein
MMVKILIGCFMIVATSLVHTLVTYLVFYLIHKQLYGKSLLRKILNVNYIVLITTLAAFLEAAIWSGTYLAIGAFRAFEEAMYFSFVTFTTVGYGDIVLREDFRLLGSLEAANGVIMFGWSTAIVITAIQKVYFQQKDVPAGN